MKINHLIMCVLFIAVSSFVAAGQAVSETAKVGKLPKYEELLAKVQGGDTKIDYKALRIGYSQS